MDDPGATSSLNFQSVQQLLFSARMPASIRVRSERGMWKSGPCGNILCRTPAMRKMKASRRAAICFVGLLLPAACMPRSYQHMNEIDALMQRYDGAVPGASLLVVQNGKPVVKRSYGLADVEA